MIKIKPCPFCKGENLKKIKRANFYYIACDICGAQGPGAITEKAAKLLWNDAPRMENNNLTAKQILTDTAAPPLKLRKRM